MASRPWSRSTPSRPTPGGAPCHRRDRGRDGGARRAVQPLRRRRPRCDGARRGRRRRGRRAVRVHAALPGRGHPARQDRDHRDADLRRRRRRVRPGGRPAARQLRAQRLRPPADLHGQDPALALHDPALKGAPTGWTLPVREVRASVGAGFIYPICGEMRTMPGLGTHPAASIIDIDENGEIVGLS